MPKSISLPIASPILKRVSKVSVVLARFMPAYQVTAAEIRKTIITRGKDRPSIGLPSRKRVRAQCYSSAREWRILDRGKGASRLGRRLAARPERGRAKLSTWERLLTPTTTLLTSTRSPAPETVLPWAGRMTLPHQMLPVRPPSSPGWPGPKNESTLFKHGERRRTQCYRET